MPIPDAPLDAEAPTEAAAESDLPARPGETDELGTRQRAGRFTGRSVLGALRWSWYTLTSMRTALILLFLLALAAVPGSLLPQRGTNPVRVGQYFARHPVLAPVLDHLGGFDVYGSAWFAAVYLLLFVSLAGCVIPRSRRHLSAMRARPPAAPRHLSRLPVSDGWTTELSEEQALAAAHATLRSRHYRVDRTASTVNAEKGHLRETGNLLFHTSLLVVLLGIAVTSAFGFSGSALVKEHDGFADTQLDYDSLSAGRLVDVAKLPPFSFTLDSFAASYVRTGSSRGEASGFKAGVTWQSSPDSSSKQTEVEVNHPLTVDGTNVYLSGHGYAPHVVVHDGSGKVFDEVVPFLPSNTTFESQGVVKLPDAAPQQIGISGIFLPTASADPLTNQPISIFPAADNPALVIGVFEGDLGLDSGVPQSVYSLDTSKMKLIATGVLRPGQTLTLPDGGGSVTFAGYSQWANLQITHDPGKRIVLVAVVCVIVGLLLSLGIRRRRVWVRASGSGTGRTVVEIGGLTRTDASGGFEDEFRRLVEAVRNDVPRSPDGGLQVTPPAVAAYHEEG